jgi:hypothetical protein
MTYDRCAGEALVIPVLTMTTWDGNATLVSVTGADFGGGTSSGARCITSTANFLGTDTFTYLATDGEAPPGHRDRHGDCRPAGPGRR